MSENREPGSALFTTNKTADAHRAAVLGAAIEAGLRAWRAGENIQTVLTTAGFARDIIQNVVDYVQNDPEEADREGRLYEQSTPQRPRTSQQEPQMSASKRQKTGHGRSTIPVAPSVKQYVKKCMDRQLEKKQYQNTADMADADLDVGGVVFPTTKLSFFSGITQGDTFSTREGNHIRVYEVDVRFVLNFSYAAASNTSGSSCPVRCLIVKRANASGVAPAVTDVLATTDYYSGYNTTNVPARFNILRDWTAIIKQDLYVSATTTNVRQTYRKLIKFKDGLPIDFSGTAGTYADIQRNNVFLIVVPAADECVAFAGSVTVHFTDN